jgi:hypothetical protein
LLYNGAIGMSFPLVLALVVGLLIVLVVATRGRYYRRMFSQAHCQSFYEGLARAISVARAQAHRPPSLDDGTAFVTEAGLAAAVTCAPEPPGACTLHLSLSQAGAHTTAAVASRFSFLALAMLRQNRCQLTPFRMPSGVRHLVLQFESPDFSVAPFAEAYAAYLSDYRPVPYVSAPDEAAGR